MDNSCPFMVIPVKKTCSRRERDLVNLVDYAARVASELLTIAVKLLIIAVQRKKMLLEHKKKFMEIPGQLMVIPVQSKNAPRA